MTGIEFPGRTRHMPLRKSGGRSIRQPGQVRKEAAVTISLRVVPASTSLAALHAGPMLSPGDGGAFSFWNSELRPICRGLRQGGLLSTGCQTGVNLRAEGMSIGVNLFNAGRFCITPSTSPIGTASLIA